MSRTSGAIDRLKFERELWATGMTRVAGVDEAGRGPLAGPVVAAVVIFEPQWIQEMAKESLSGLNDSKQLTEQKREHYFSILTQSPQIRFGISIVEAAEIDRMNILQATHQAMNRALEKLRPSPQHVLVDGRPVRSIIPPSTAIVQGDSKSYSIAAASVLAKVTRDRLMLEYDREFPGYGFAGHKGYGTAQHLAAIEKLGPCRIHRMTFAPLKKDEPYLFSGMEGGKATE